MSLSRAWRDRTWSDVEDATSFQLSTRATPSGHAFTQRIVLYQLELSSHVILSYLREYSLYFYIPRKCMLYMRYIFICLYIFVFVCTRDWCVYRYCMPLWILIWIVRENNYNPKKLNVIACTGKLNCALHARLTRAEKTIESVSDYLTNHNKGN